MRKMLEDHPEREATIRRIGTQEGLNLTGNMRDDWHGVVMEADAEGWNDGWEEMFRGYCRDIIEYREG
uniref:Uncharacterized protein n=1 Tax=viral metagenome TaxID=1070528 RepID=A0A6H1ZEZ1_9ZZZZ